jgi:hypothetical protein
MPSLSPSAEKPTAAARGFITRRPSSRLTSSVGDWGLPRSTRRAGRAAAGATPPGKRTGKKWAKFFQGQYDILRKLRVCDPACGSGAFLIEAFNYLEGQYEEVIEDLIAFEECGEAELEKINPTILRENLYGVDLSQEAVEITKLALWIRTAELGKPLSNLSANVQWGNSVVADPAVHPKAFDWPARYDAVAAAGGFDVVIGNPPYVQELLSAIKPHLRVPGVPRDGRFVRLFR